MKKRVLMLALIAALVMSFSASAWADNIYFDVSDVATSTKLSDVKAGDEVTISFTFTYNAYPETQSKDHYKNANLVRWTIGNGSSFTVEESKVATYGTNSYGNASDGDCYLWNIGSSTAGATTKLSVDVIGTINDVSSGLPINLTLYAGNVESSQMASSTALSNASGAVTYGGSDLTIATSGTDVDTGSSTTISVNNSDDPANPYGDKWNGIDPIISQDINTDSYDIGKNKPKLGKVDKKALTLESGKAATITVPMLGPIEELDVYIAAKDGAKLWPDSVDKKSGPDIHLTSASIKAYNIPFRITAYTLASKVDGADAKAQQKAWKSAENSLTITYNGAKVEYKGYPITISMSNSATSKPVAKAIKINVTPNTSVPAWEYSEWEEDVKTVKESEVLKTDGSHSNKNAAIVSLDAQYVVFVEKLSSRYSEHNLKITSGEVSIAEASSKVTASVDVSYSYTTGAYVTKKIDKKGVELVSAVLPDHEKAYAFEGEYTVSIDKGPYVITVKPDPTKDAAKIDKFMDKWSVDIVQPTFDYLGNIEDQGYVFIKGTPKNTAKESKLAFTLTATNPSTKKKGAGKVTAIGKTLPVIQKTDTVSTDVDKYKVLQGYKAVEAGKTPSVKVKAKGSKTIGYKLGVWGVDDGKPYESQYIESIYYDEATDTETLIELYDGEVLSAADYAALLARHKLSFDEKKGAIILANKSDKATTATVDEDGENFESMDIWITAYNNVGVDHVQAWIGITGAKPKVSDKNVEFKGTIYSEDLKTFKVMAGKSAAESIKDGSANVKVYPADSTASSALAKYGLALVTYNGITKTLDSMDYYASGDTIANWKDISADLVSGTVASDGKDTPTYTATTPVYVKNGKTYVDTEYEDSSKKNYGILEVTDPAALVAAAKANTDKINKGVKINLTLENLGATQKGTITIIADSKLVNGSAPVSASKTVSASRTVNATDTVTVNAKKTGSGGSSYGAESYNAESETDEAEETEGKLTLGAERTAADLSAAQQAFLAEKGYTVIAVLPEMTSDASKQYDLEVDLDEEAPEGEEMIYIPFPKDVPEVEDDSIVDFYDEAGAPVEGVPASHKIIASPWFRENVTYEPVIAIEAK